MKTQIKTCWSRVTICYHKGRSTYDVHENGLIFKTPHSPHPSMSKIFPPLWPWESNFKRESPAPTFSNKLWNINRTMHVNERNQNKNKTRSSHIQIDHAFCCSSAMVSFKGTLMQIYQYLCLQMKIIY